MKTTTCKDFPTLPSSRLTTFNHPRNTQPMKSLAKIFCLTTYVLLLTTATHAQTIRRVNNNPGVTGVNVYTTAQAAHDAAVANDILMIEPSSTSYGDLILTKPLKVYGNGYYLDTNTELKVDNRSSTLETLAFNTGSGGSLISGLEITGYRDLNYGLNQYSSIAIHGVSNIEIQRCKLSFGLYLLNYSLGGTIVNTNVSNIIIRKNYLQNGAGPGAIAISPYPIAGYTISNVIVENNIISSGGLRANNSTIQNWVVTNNTFTTSTPSLVNSVFANNLLVGGGSITFNNVSSSFNVSSTVSFSNDSGNQNSVNVTNELIGTGTGISLDEQYQLKSGSTLKTAGSGGTEVGAYGGATPYVVSGISAIPSIVNMSNTATGSNTVPLQVTISVKSNN